MQDRILYHDIKVSPTLSNTVKTTTKILQHRKRKLVSVFVTRSPHVKLSTNNKCVCMQVQSSENNDNRE